MAVTVKVDGTTYDGINTITTGGKTLALQAPAGGWIDPMDYYRANRPAEWPFIPLPPALENSSSEYYAGGKTAIYLLYKKNPGDVFLTDLINVGGSNITGTVQKYANASTPVGSEETITVQSNHLTFEYTDADADWSQYNYIVFKITADPLSDFGYGGRRSVNGYPLSLNNYTTSLVELSGTAPGLETFSFGNTNYRAIANLEYFSFGAHAKTSMQGFFMYARNLRTVPYLNTADVTNMQSMFDGCSNLETVPLMDTSEVTNMMLMFHDCVSIRAIPAFDMSNVTGTPHMFNGCTALQSFFGADTGSATDMKQMFYGCTSLQSVGLMDTGACTNMREMFRNCSSLKTIPAFDTHAVTDMKNMFNGCTSLQSIPLLDTHAVTDMTTMFSGCSNLQTIPALNMSSCTGVSFANCYSLQSAKIRNSAAMTGGSAFTGCNNVKLIDMDVWNSTSNFSNCNGLMALIIRSFDADTALSSSSAFSTCYHITGATNANYNPDGAHDGYIYVPDNMVETIKAAANWSTYASQIKGLSELPDAA